MKLAKNSAICLLAFVCALLLSLLSVSAQVAPSKSTAAGHSPKMKAIWESVNYSEDLGLTDVYFTSPEEGWVTGAAGTILHTSDGGKTWTAQLGGDPKATDRPIRELRFIDATHGFAVQSTGEVQGLTRDVGCNLARLAFPSAQAGYAVSQGIGKSGSVLAKTEDGGATWTPQLILPGEDAREGALIFTSQKMGVLRAGAKMFRTTDGGQTWTGAIGQIGGKPEVKFADDNVGWAIAYQTMMYTTDGGQKWTSRNIAFPASVNAFALAGKDNGYVVGDHGMVYRYHVVPISYTGKGMLDAPMMY